MTDPQTSAADDVPTEGAAPIRVALVDDQQLIRSGLAMLIGSQPDLEVVAEASTGREAVGSPAVARADVVLMDVRMPEMDGIEATRTLLQRPDAPRVVVLTTFDLDEYAFDAIEAGASGFLLKDAPPEEMLAAIRTVHRGDAVIAPSSTRRLLEHLVGVLPAEGSTGGHPGLDELIEREREVLVLMARGRVAAAGAPADVLTAERVSRVYGWPVAVASHHGAARGVAPQVVPLDAA